MSICYIVGAGDFYSGFAKNEGDIIIAADGGYDSLIKCGYTPDVLIGDFDSISAELPQNVRTVRHPKEKDETDMFLAYREGVRLGYSHFVMLGATGGRLDHTFANLSLLLYAKEQGNEITLCDKRRTIVCLKNEERNICGNEGDTFSVFAIGGEALGVSIRGAKYEADNVTLSPSFPLGVSNELKKMPATVSVTDGALLVMTETR